jgi:hypothetical protein
MRQLDEMTALKDTRGNGLSKYQKRLLGKPGDSSLSTPSTPDICGETHLP